MPITKELWYAVTVSLAKRALNHFTEYSGKSESNEISKRHKLQISSDVAVPKLNRYVMNY